MFIVLLGALAAALARDHTVVVPDLRGMGLSSHPVGGYDKRTQAADVRAVLTHLGLEGAAVVGHDLGTMVAYAYAARYPDQTEKLVVMDAPIPGIPPWTTSSATLFTSGNLSPGLREDRGNRWVIAAFALIGLLDAYLPAYTDRKEFWTIDGDPRDLECAG